jgi:hypothetical protein
LFHDAAAESGETEGLRWPRLATSGLSPARHGMTCVNFEHRPKNAFARAIFGKITEEVTD